MKHLMMQMKKEITIVRSEEGMIQQTKQNLQHKAALFLTFYYVLK